MNRYMEEALKEAKKAYKKKEVPVGAIILKDGKIIAKAHNLRERKKSALAHAEILAIKKACKKLKSWRLDGTQMYVTLEPCPMCAGALILARVSKVYIGSIDEKNGCIVSKSKILDVDTTHKVEYEFLEDSFECSKILKDFFSQLRKAKKK
ncbi:MAG: nucleoside deaminase [Clostridia bacterium]